MHRLFKPRVIGFLTGAAILAAAAHFVPGCTTMPEYIGVGFHFTTRPPTPRTDSAPTPAATDAARR